MNNEQILENNKLIGEFMGGSFTDKYKAAPKNIPVFAIDANTVEKLGYHASWDWLMPVVEQINKRDWVTIYSDECKIHALQADEFETIQIIGEGKPLPDTVYAAVVQYINLNLK